MASNATDQTNVAHEATSAHLRALDVSVTVVALVFVVLRFLSRWQRHLKIGVDDYLIAAAMVLLFANLGLNWIMIENGLGIHATELEIDQLIMIAKVLFALEPLYLLYIAMVKIAILVMYCRIFALQGFKIAAYLISTITILWSLVFLFVCIFQCYPINRAWNSTIPGTCLNLRAIFIGNAIPNIVTDAAILVMPMRQVWKLQIRLVQRISLSMIFLLGCFVIFASVYRLTTLLQMDQNDISYTITNPTTWSHVEMSTAIVSACLPTLKPLIQLVMRKVGVGSSKEKSQNSYTAWQSGIVSIGGTRADRNMKTHQFEELEGNGSTDEVPLKAIRVQKDVEQSSQKNEAPEGPEQSAKYW